MKTSHRGFIVPLLLILVALFLVGGGAYVYVQNKQTISSDASITDWKTYENSQYKYSFQYPQNFVNDMRPGEMWQDFSSTDFSTTGLGYYRGAIPQSRIDKGGKFQVSVEKWPDLSWKDYSFERLQASEGSGFSTKKVMVGEDVALYRDYVPDAKANQSNVDIVFYHFDGTDLFHVQLVMTSAIGQKKEYQAIFDQIISTFKFASSTVPTSNSQTTNLKTASTSSMAEQAPFISSLSPASGPGGTMVTIKGSGLTQSTDIYFNGEVVQNREKYNGSPSFRVPLSIGNCPSGAYCELPPPIPAGAYSVQVSNAGGKSNTVTFTVTSEKVVSIPVTATLTVGTNGSNPSHSITIKSGDSIKYNWSRSNGTFGAGYTAEGCVDKNMDTTNTSTSAAPWGFFAGTANGSTDNFIVDNKWAGCTVLVTYSVFGEDGAKSDTVTVHVSR